jgi:hypothetical protein
MIGLIFYSAIGLWLLVAFFLGVMLPHWLKLKPAWAWLFVPLMIFAPVMDEVIALPQAYALCKQAEEAFWYDPTAKGKVLKYYSNYSREEKTIGLNIKTITERSSSVLVSDGSPVIKTVSIDFSAGFLNMPAGSNGKSMPLLLPETCPSRSWSINKYQNALKLLELTTEPRPNPQ